MWVLFAPMPDPAPFALSYEIAVARGAKTEAEHFPTVLVMPPAGESFVEPSAEALAHGFELCVAAVRSLDPETAHMAITPNGQPQPVPLDELRTRRAPDFEEAGWRVWIEWNAAADG